MTYLQKLDKQDMGSERSHVEANRKMQAVVKSIPLIERGDFQWGIRYIDGEYQWYVQLR